ncbi:ccr4 associated factor [Maudiozyma exigua]|uniref:Ccr4 associated factor n=1 Tax=Maudiozyma exigua TaxID=34358 RepID=A0A9P6WC75_MAUEX|nr:ccr4 associated factor [Kazachstania exigua]
MLTNNRYLWTKLKPLRQSIYCTSRNILPFYSSIRWNSTENQPVKISGLFKYAGLNSKSYIRVHGPEAVKFINGLVSSKLQESFIKKNLTTITDDTKKSGNSLQQEIVPVSQFDITKCNWGLYHESGDQGPYIGRFGQYTAFLDGKGKLITDLILYPTPLTIDNINLTRYPEYLIELDKGNMSDKMLKTLEGHKILSKVKINLIEPNKIRTWDVSIRFQNIPQTEENPWIDNILRPMGYMKTPEDSLSFTNTVVGTLFKGYEDKIIALYIERRTDQILEKDGSAPLMFRILTDDTIEDVSTIFNQDAFPFEFEVLKEEETTFRELRLSYGLVDGVKDVKPTTVLPLELNFDYFPDVVSSNKGCYIGQELTARTFATGILRKRVVPVKITNVEALSEYVNRLDQESEKYPEVQMKSSENSADAIDTESSEKLAPSPFASTKTVRKRKRPVGSLIAFENDVGIVMFRTEYFNKIFQQDDTTREKPTLYIDIGADASEDAVTIEAQEPFWLNEWFKSNKPKLF